MQNPKRGDHVRLPNGDTGWINRLLDERGRANNTGPQALILLDAETWDGSVITVDVGSLEPI